MSKRNALSKYADDTSLMSPQHTDCSIEQEFDHVLNWSSENKLTINKTKTQEIIFYKSNKIAHKHDIPLIPGIARVEEVRLLGVILTSNLSWSRHIDSGPDMCIPETLPHKPTETHGFGHHGS